MINTTASKTVRSVKRLVKLHISKDKLFFLSISENLPYPEIVGCVLCYEGLPSFNPVSEFCALLFDYRFSIAVVNERSYGEQSVNVKTSEVLDFASKQSCSVEMIKMARVPQRLSKLSG